jgi:hypothetical protein
MQKQKLTKLIAPSVPLILEVEGPNQTTLKLELELSWTMSGVIILESKLRELGIKVNVLRGAADFWDKMDSATLCTAVWAFAQSRDKTYADEAGFDTIASYITPENFVVATAGLQEAFMQSLSEKRRKEIEDAIKAAQEGSSPDPTLAPEQTQQ